MASSRLDGLQVLFGAQRTERKARADLSGGLTGARSSRLKRRG
jgi:hypothetical protein